MLAKGPLEDFRDGPLTEYRGLYPYLEEAAFETWRKKLLAAEKESSTVAAETKCRVWLIDRCKMAPAPETKSIISRRHRKSLAFPNARSIAPGKPQSPRRAEATGASKVVLGKRDGVSIRQFILPIYFLSRKSETFQRTCKRRVQWPPLTSWRADAP